MPAGRPRAFDEKAALGAALRVFWEKGYEGATLDELTTSMGVNRPSLYAAFGDKKALFRKSMELYLERPAAHVREGLAEPTARKVVERLIYGTIDRVTDPGNPRGCFMVQAALVCGASAECVRREMAKKRERVVVLLRRRFQRAIVEGDLSADERPGDLARYVATMMHGISVEAASGASRRELRRVADWVLARWPSV